MFTNVREALSSIPNPSDAERFVLAHGREFQSKPRPQGMRKRRVGLCYQSAYRIAIGGHQSAIHGASFYYVEGFAMGHGFDVFIQHAWLTTDGTDAIDPCIPDASLGTYIGVPFSTRAAGRIMLTRRRHTFLDPVDDVVLSAMAEHPFAAP